MGDSDDKVASVIILGANLVVVVVTVVSSGIAGFSEYKAVFFDSSGEGGTFS